MGLLEHLNRVNPMPVLPVESGEFRTYGRIVEGFDFSAAAAYLEENTPIPAEGNIYTASVPELEALPVITETARRLYGGMPIQAGFCNGRNSTFNGFEYHKGSEINLAVTDLALALGHRWDIRDGYFRSDAAEVFFVKKGTAIELYETTLHLSPLRVRDEGFRAMVVLPRGTNTPLDGDGRAAPWDSEEKLLLMRNKWILAHPQREVLIRQGAFPGLLGENRQLLY